MSRLPRHPFTLQLLYSCFNDGGNHAQEIDMTPGPGLSLSLSLSLGRMPEFADCLERYPTPPAETAPKATRPLVVTPAKYTARRSSG